MLKDKTDNRFCSFPSKIYCSRVSLQLLEWNIEWTVECNNGIDNGMDDQKIIVL